MGKILNKLLWVLSEIHERETSLTRGIFKLIFAIDVSCLAKERCIPNIDNFEIYIYIYMCVCV